MRDMLIGVALVLAMAVASGAAAAQDTTPGVTVTGSAEVTRAPDLAIVRLGVAREASSSARAVEAMTTGIASVLGALASEGIAEADIRTEDLRLAPVRDDTERVPGTPRPVVAATTVSVRVSDLDALGPLIDAAVRAGANRVDGVDFTLSDPAAAREAAQRAAFADASVSAETYAAAAGVALGPVVSLTDHGGGMRPVAMDSLGAAAAVPVAPGRVSVTARVTVVFGLGG